MAAALDTIPGLGRLSSLTYINIKQQYSSYKGNNYAIVYEEELLYNLIEEIHEGGVFSGGNRRGFNMDGLDSEGRKVFSLRRPGMSLSDKVELFVNDTLVSVVRMASTFLKPVFSINDAQDCPTLLLKGKICDNAHNFELQTESKTVIGVVQKINRGWRKEMLTRNDDYVITFPADLAVHFKLAVVVATILIDFRFHEYKR